MKKSGTNRKKRIILKAIGTVLAMPFMIILVIMILLYVPAIQRHAVNKCSELMGKYMKNKLKNIKFACIYLAVVNFNLEQQVYKVIGPT